MPQKVTQEMLSDTDMVEPIKDGDLEISPESEGKGEGETKLTKTDETSDETAEGKPSYKFKSFDEYEKALKAAERRMHQATEESSRYQRMVQNLSPKAPETKESQTQKIAKEAIRQIRTIPDTDPEKEEKAAIIWAEAQEKIADLKYQEQHTAETSRKEVETYAENKAKAAGLKSPMAIEAFWVVARNAPKNISLDEQIDWAVTQVNQFIEEIRKEDAEKVEESETGKKSLKVLGRGGKGPTPSKEGAVEMPTLGDALKAAANKRRLGEKDFR